MNKQDKAVAKTFTVLFGAAVVLISLALLVSGVAEAKPRITGGNLPPLEKPRITGGPLPPELSVSLPKCRVQFARMCWSR
jgi:hypothetical protein